MSQGKQNKFLVIYSSVLGAGALLLGYLGWSASSAADEAEQQYKTAADTLQRLETAPLSRTKENADEKKERVDAFVAQVRELNSKILSYQVPVNASESNESFQRKLSDATKAVKDNATARGVKLDPKFDLGMGNYLSSFPVTGAASRLSAQLDAIVYLANTAMEKGMTSIDSLTREQLPFETEKAEPKSTAPLSEADKRKAEAKKKADAAAAAKAGPKGKAPVGPALDPSKVLERQPLEITVTGKNRSVLNFLQALANPTPDTAPHFFVIRTLRVENNEKDGPQKSVQVEVKEIQLDPNDKASVYTQDAVFLLGNENVKIHLDLDLIRFVDLPEETAVPKKGAEKPVSKPKAVAPAPSASNTPAPSAANTPSSAATPAPSPASTPASTPPATSAPAPAPANP